MRVVLGCVALFLLLYVPAQTAAADDKAQPTPAEAISTFKSAWDDATWLPKSQGKRPGGYMRPLDDTGWKQRMRTLRGLAEAGSKSVGPLLKSLEDGSVAERILAAQALGFLPASSAGEALLRAAERDKEPAVRLYAIDSLGMIGNRNAEPLRALEAKESNRDVKRHLAYAIERKDKGVETLVTDQLKRFDTKQMDTAQLGKPAPDFELPSLSGDKVRLSSYRGKKAVVLVFIYGDT